MVDSVSVRFKNARVERMPLDIRMQWNAGTACVLECVLKTLACQGLRVGPSKSQVSLEMQFPPGNQGKGGKNLRSQTWTLKSQTSFSQISVTGLNSGKQKNPNPNFLVWISSAGGVGVFHVKGWGPKSSVCPSRIPHFLAGYPGILPGYPGGARKVWEKKCVQFSSPINWQKRKFDYESSWALSRKRGPAKTAQFSKVHEIPSSFCRNCTVRGKPIEWRLVSRLHWECLQETCFRLVEEILPRLI